ncbi:MAG: FAD-dependent oxidoreductase, partial [Acidobacteriota bacterium]
CRHQLVELGYLESAAGGGEGGSSVAFNVQPRAGGELLIGSSRQQVVSNLEIEPAVLQRMLARADHFLPGITSVPTVRTWTGLRPATADDLPYIGPLQNRRSLILAAGHEGLGITTAPGTARLVGDHLLGRPAPLDPAPYLPSRCAARRSDESSSPPQNPRNVPELGAAR